VSVSILLVLQTNLIEADSNTIMGFFSDLSNYVTSADKLFENYLKLEITNQTINDLLKIV